MMIVLLGTLAKFLNVGTSLTIWMGIPPWYGPSVVAQ